MLSLFIHWAVGGAIVLVQTFLVNELKSILKTYRILCVKLRGALYTVVINVILMKAQVQLFLGDMHLKYCDTIINLVKECKNSRNRSYKSKFDASIDKKHYLKSSFTSMEWKMYERM